MLGNINDSIYSPFDVVTPIELGRIITPYGGNYGSQWKNTWTFDVTDYATVLQDSVRINAFYGGWQNGFTR